MIHTTPEAIDLQASFRAMLDAGDRACAIEVSSHALALHRADGTHFAAAIFTNLTQDHLDFHATMEDYFAAKRRLFEGDAGARASINVDDPYGAPARAPSIPDAVTFALDAPRRLRRARAALRRRRRAASSPRTPEGELELRTRLPGRFNVANVLGALAADAPRSACRSSRSPRRCPTSRPRPGRFQALDEGQPFTRARRLRPHARLARERAARGARARPAGA